MTDDEYRLSNLKRLAWTLKGCKSRYKPIPYAPTVAKAARAFETPKNESVIRESFGKALLTNNVQAAIDFLLHYYPDCNLDIIYNDHITGRGRNGLRRVYVKVDWDFHLPYRHTEEIGGMKDLSKLILLATVNAKITDIKEERNDD